MGGVGDVRDLLKLTDQKAASAETMASKAAAAAATIRIDLGEATLTFTAAVSVQLGVVAVTTALGEARVGDMLTIRPATAWPTGYALTGYAFVPVNGQMEIRLLIPAITLNVAGPVSLKVRAFALRSA